MVRGSQQVGGGGVQSLDWGAGQQGERDWAPHDILPAQCRGQIQQQSLPLVSGMTVLCC